MENNLTPELIEKARRAKSPEELLALAGENGIEATEEEARDYFEQLNKSGELSDDELDNVSGGGCGGDNKPKCRKCGGTLVYTGSTFPRKSYYYACQRCHRICCSKDGYSLRDDNCPHCGAKGIFYR